MHSNVKFVLYHTLRSECRIEEGWQDAIVEEIIDAYGNVQLFLGVDPFALFERSRSWIPTPTE
ncbi:hypothetical protein GBA52_027434 [Prunus armeniaca]|nr:hypothetical protein GBA52_027434 [Prunus armeniaca]